MKTLIILLLASAALSAPARAEVCTEYCNPNVSKPCGLGCISKFKSCHKPTTTACSGIAESKKKNVYENPKHVDPGQTQTEKN